MSVNVAIYGDVDLNLLDGSAIWLQSVTAAFAGAGANVTTLLKSPIHTDRLTAPIAATSGVNLLRPFEDGLMSGLKGSLSPYQAGLILREQAPANGWDAVVVRGWRVVRKWVDDAFFDGQLWPYLTDVPQDVRSLTPAWREQLTEVVAASRFLLCQTDELRAFLEAEVPGAVGRAVLFPPMIPSTRDEIRPSPRSDEPFRLVYAGKFAPLWNTWEMLDVPSMAAAAGVDVELHMIGDKIHRVEDDPDYQERMREGLRTRHGVHWHGGMSREDTMREMAAAHAGLGWRHPELDRSLELSTKVLEYGSLGLPVLLNRTPMHEALLGDDYPAFVSSAEDLVKVTARLRSSDVYRLAATRCLQAARQFTLERATERVASYLRRARPPARVVGRRRRVLVASHDLKFFDRILQHLDARPDVDVAVDEWSALAEHDAEESQALLADADVVICEWCGPNAAWYSRHVRPEQRLIVRLHRFEIDAGYWRNVIARAVDTVVCVSPHYRDLTIDKTSFEPSQTVVIPNFVDPLTLDRPKAPGAEFRLGFIGMAPARKRMDLALDVLARLRQQDDRFRLHVKSKLPWHYWWIWQRPAEREHYEEVFARLSDDPVLRGAVVFEPFGPDVGAWLQSVGFVLSTSDDESFHLAPAEGMMSRAVPVVRTWPGADTIYADRWLYDDADAMAEAILASVHDGTWRHDGARAFDDVQVYTEQRVTDIWDQLVDGTFTPTPQQRMMP